MTFNSLELHVHRTRNKSFSELIKFLESLIKIYKLEISGTYTGVPGELGRNNLHHQTL